ncbi:MAG TPA: hypothetical protein VHT52_18395 [Stellaceae bacterium]|nr:hypothetical protein [Stellaceae bacterium]
MRGTGAGRFPKGRSGIPVGLPRGCRDRVELALAGDPTTLRLCLERIITMLDELEAISLPGRGGG